MGTEESLSAQQQGTPTTTDPRDSGPGVAATTTTPAGGLTQPAGVQTDTSAHQAGARPLGGRLIDPSAVPRTRGALVGFALLVLGVWGAVVPFIGPYFNYQFIDSTAWSFPTYGRLWLEILPGALAVLAGLMLIAAGHRRWGATAGVLGVVAGTWFVIGQTVSQFWNHGVSQAGIPLGSNFLRAIEQLGYFYLLGVVILLLGALALARMSSSPGRART